MANKMLNTFDVWITAQGVKSRTRLRSVDNISLEGVVRLRELILNLAVSGKLTQQLPSDESATSLLNKIIAEKKKFVEQGLIKESRNFGQIEEDEIPYSLPTGWCWTRLGNIGIGSTGKTPSTNNSSLFGGEIPFIGPGQISNQGEILNSENTLTEEGSQYSTIANKGDILMVCIGGSIGKTAIVKSIITFNQQINCIRPILVDSSYLNFVMNSSQFQAELLEKSTGSATPIINRGKWEELLVSLPPLAEQYRIVAKVDELMALCDALEQQETEHLKSHQLLVETLLGTLTRAADFNEFQHAWNKLYEHFDDLFTTEDSIDQLKQTILQLAVMGKLVAQDPNDEPASELLKRIDYKKKALISEGKIKDQKSLPEITEQEKLFQLPNGWAFVRLNNVIDVRDGTHDSPKDASGTITYPLVTSANFVDGKIDFDGARRISESDHREISKRSKVEKYDILFSMIGGNLGNQVIVEDDTDFSIKNVALFKYYDRELTNPYFFKRYFEFLAMDLQSRAKGGAQPFVSLGFLRNLLLALPPINEQNRIVSKVDELFALCDRLKKRIAEAQKVANQMAEGVVEQV